jgi:hypothetical protein
MGHRRAWRANLYQLCLKHPLPLPMKTFAGQSIGGGCKFTSKLGHPRGLSWR